MIDRVICPCAKRCDASTAEKFRTAGIRGRGRARSSYTWWSPRSPWAIATRRSVYYSRCNYTFSGCWQSTIPCLSLTFHLPGCECKSAGGGTSRALLLLGARGDSTNKTIARVATCHRLLLSTRALDMYGPNYYRILLSDLYDYIVSCIVHQQYCKKIIINLRIHFYVQFSHAFTCIVDYQFDNRLISLVIEMCLYTIV